MQNDVRFERQNYYLQKIFLPKTIPPIAFTRLRKLELFAANHLMPKYKIKKEKISAHFEKEIKKSFGK